MPPSLIRRIRAPRLPRGRRLILLAGGILGMLLIAWGAYVIVGNWYIRERLPGRLNEDPASFLAEWDHAETWWPGHVSATGVRLRKVSSGNEWEMRLDAGRARFAMIPLLFEHLSVNRLRGDGFTLRFRFVPGSTPGREVGSPHAPPIEGLPDPPLQPRPPAALPPKPPEDERWTYHFDDLEIGGVREAWVGPFRLAGDGRLAASMDFRPGDSIEVSNFAFKVLTGDVHVGPDVLASGLQGGVSVELDRFDMKERPALEVFDEMSAHVIADAALHDVQLPRSSFPRIPWLGFGGDIGRGSVEARLQDGAFAPGTKLRLEAGDFTVDYPGYLVQGATIIEGDVERDGLRSEGRVNATFREFTIRKEGSPSAHVRGAGFVAELRTRDLTIRDPLETFQVDMTLPDSEIVDFSAYDSTIPAPLRVRIESGTGTIHGLVAITQDGGHGELGVDGTDIVLRHGSDLMRLDMLLQAKIPVLDFQAGTYDFSGTELGIRHGRLVGAGPDEEDDPEGWWGDFVLDRLLLQKGGDPLADVEVSGNFRDTEPMVAIVARDKPLLKLVRPVLVAPNAQVHASMKAGPDRVDMDELTVTGEKLDLRACLDLRGESGRGVFYVDGGMLSAGFKFQDGRRNVKPLAGKDWYPEHSPLCEDPAHLPPD